MWWRSKIAGNGDILDFDAANAPQDELAVQTHHITAEELYDIPEIRDLLLEAGVTVTPHLIAKTTELALRPLTLPCFA